MSFVYITASLDNYDMANGPRIKEHCINEAAFKKNEEFKKDFKF